MWAFYISNQATLPACCCGFGQLKLELVTDTNSNCCLVASVAEAVAVHAWIDSILSAQVRHECVQVSTLRQEVVSTQVELGQLALGGASISKCQLVVLNASQQVQRSCNSVVHAQFEDVSLGVVEAANCEAAWLQVAGSAQSRCVCQRLLSTRPVTIQACWTSLVASAQAECFQSCVASVAVTSERCVAQDRSVAGVSAARCAQFRLVVSSEQTQWAVSVLTAQTERLTVRSLASCFAEAVDCASCEAGQIWCVVTDGIVGTCTFQTVEVVTDGTSYATEILNRSPLADVVQDVSLTTQQNGTEVAAQTDYRFTTEQVSSALVLAVQCAGVVVEASFQLEQSLQTAAQIFNAFETQTRTLDNAGVNAEFAASAASGCQCFACVNDASINDTVDGYGALSLCCTCDCAEYGQCD